MTGQAKNETIVGGPDMAAAHFRDMARDATSPRLRAAALFMASFAPALDAALKEIIKGGPITVDEAAHGLGSALASVAQTFGMQFCKSTPQQGPDALQKHVINYAVSTTERAPIAPHRTVRPS